MAEIEDEDELEGDYDYDLGTIRGDRSDGDPGGASRCCSPAKLRRSA
jgi:hypothetical protein